mmetsp:Transcript_19297/g.27149  ORF Transcript_19297/g.27149 Transcript_19297/m.27149 type:complete len:151 (-) Transcript_19297:884-1336(-)
MGIIYSNKVVSRERNFVNSSPLLHLMKLNGIAKQVPNSPLGNAFEKYQCQASVPYSELLFSNVLKYKTSNSGHVNFCQRIESIGTVDTKHEIPVEIPMINALFTVRSLLGCSKKDNPMVNNNIIESHRNIAVVQTSNMQVVFTSFDNHEV